MIHHSEVIAVLLFRFSILVFTSVSVGEGMENNEKNGLKFALGALWLS